MAEKRSDVLRQEGALTRRDPQADFGSPFRMLERFADEMDRVFDDFGYGRLTPRTGRSWTRSPWRGELDEWAPEIEVFHRNNELIVRADLPGLTKHDVKVNVTDASITIEGERKRAHEEEREGVYRSERSYGSFYRVIPLPEGTIADQAKATFKDGVLEIAVPAPPEQVRHGRRLEIMEGSPAKK